MAVYTQAGTGSPTISGGVLIEVPAITSIEAWGDLHGLVVVDGAVTLYKAVDDDYATERSRAAGIFYRPGSAEIVAPDWDPRPECGGGLHVSPSPGQALDFHREATRFVAVRVMLADLRVPEAGDAHGKGKARRVLGPIVEVDAHGRPVVAPKAKRTRKGAVA